jgi:DNA-binding transcriptional LysR family regulator
MVAAHILTGERHVIASPEFWARHRAVEVPADLTDLPFIAYGAGPAGLDWVFARNGKTELARMQPKIRLSAIEGVREAVFAGLGFAIGSEWIFPDARGTGSVERKLEDYRLPAIDLWTIFPAGRQPSARARLFAEFLKRSMAAKVGWLDHNISHDRNPSLALHL